MDRKMLERVAAWHHDRSLDADTKRDRKRHAILSGHLYMVAYMFGEG